MSKVVFRKAIFPDELAWANEQYATIQFVPSSESDLVIIAEVGGVKAGLGRITYVDNHTGELGGMFVLPEFRGRSIAAGIVNTLLEQNPYATLFCIPFSHLEPFYRRFGFERTDGSLVNPSKIGAKLSWCSKAYKAETILLYRLGLVD